MVPAGPATTATVAATTEPSRPGSRIVRTTTIAATRKSPITAKSTAAIGFYLAIQA